MSKINNDGYRFPYNDTSTKNKMALPNNLGPTCSRKGAYNNVTDAFKLAKPKSAAINLVPPAKLYSASPSHLSASMNVDLPALVLEDAESETSQFCARPPARTAPIPALPTTSAASPAVALSSRETTLPAKATLVSEPSAKVVGMSETVAATLAAPSRQLVAGPQEKKQQQQNDESVKEVKQEDSDEFMFQHLAKTQQEIRNLLAGYGCSILHQQKFLKTIGFYISCCRDEFEAVVSSAQKCRRLARNISRTMDLLHHISSSFEDINREYIHRMIELVAIYVSCELRFSKQFKDQKAVVANRIMQNIYKYLRGSKKDETVSYILRMFTHMSNMYREREVVTSIFQKIIPKEQVIIQKELPDNLYIQYLVVFYHWQQLEVLPEERMRVIEFANKFMRPSRTLCTNPAYVNHLPKYTSLSNATKYILTNLQFFHDLRNASIFENRIKVDYGTIDISEDDESSGFFRDSYKINFAELVQKSEICTTATPPVKLEDKIVVATIDLTLEDNRENELAWLQDLQRNCTKTQPARNSLNLLTSGSSSQNMVIDLDSDTEDEPTIIMDTEETVTIEDAQDPADEGSGVKSVQGSEPKSLSTDNTVHDVNSTPDSVPTASPEVTLNNNVNQNSTSLPQQKTKSTTSELNIASVRSMVVTENKKTSNCATSTESPPPPPPPPPPPTPYTPLTSPLPPLILVPDALNSVKKYSNSTTQTDGSDLRSQPNIIDRNIDARSNETAQNKSNLSDGATELQYPSASKPNIVDVRSIAATQTDNNDEFVLSKSTPSMRFPSDKPNVIEVQSIENSENSLGTNDAAMATSSNDMISTQINPQISRVIATDLSAVKPERSSINTISSFNDDRYLCRRSSLHINASPVTNFQANCTDTNDYAVENNSNEEVQDNNDGISVFSSTLPSMQAKSVNFAERNQEEDDNDDGMFLIGTRCPSMSTKKSHEDTFNGSKVIYSVNTLPIRRVSNEVTSEDEITNETKNLTISKKKKLVKFSNGPVQRKRSAPIQYPIKPAIKNTTSIYNAQSTYNSHFGSTSPASTSSTVAATNLNKKGMHNNSTFSSNIKSNKDIVSIECRTNKLNGNLISTQPTNSQPKSLSALEANSEIVNSNFTSNSVVVEKINNTKDVSTIQAVDISSTNSFNEDNLDDRCEFSFEIPKVSVGTATDLREKQQQQQCDDVPENKSIYSTRTEVEMVTTTTADIEQLKSLAQGEVESKCESTTEDTEKLPSLAKDKIQSKRESTTLGRQDSICKEGMTRNNECNKLLTENTESNEPQTKNRYNEELLKGNESKDQKTMDNVCKEPMMEGNGCREQMMDGGKFKQQLLKGNESEDRKTVEEACKDPMKEENCCGDQLMDDNECNEQLLQANVVEDQKKVNNVCMKPMIEEHVLLLVGSNQDLDDNKSSEQLLQSNVDGNQKTLDDLCTKPMIEENGLRDHMMEDNNCTEKLLQTNLGGDHRDTEGNVCKKPMKEENGFIDHLMDDNKFNKQLLKGIDVKPVIKENGCRDLFIDDNKCDDELLKVIEDEVQKTVDNIYKKPLIEESGCSDQMVENNKCINEQLKSNECVAQKTVDNESIIEEKVCRNQIKDSECSEQLLKGNELQDQKTVDNVCKKPIIVENGYRDRMMDYNECNNEELLKGNKNNDQKTVNNVCKKSKIVDNEYRDQMIDDNKFSQHILEGKEGKDQKTDENVCKESMAEDSGCRDQMVDDNNRCDEQLKCNEGKDQNTLENICKEPLIEDNECRDQIMDYNESNEELFKGSEGKDHKAVSSVCKELIIEEDIYKDQIDDNKFNEQLLKGKEVEDHKTADDVCKEPMTEDSRCRDQMMDDNRCDEQLLKDSESEDRNMVDNVCKENIIEENERRDHIMDYNKLNELLLKGSEGKDQKTVDTVCKELIIEENRNKDQMIDDNKFNEQLFKDEEGEDQKAVDNVCKEPMTEGSRNRDQMLDDNRYVKELVKGNEGEGKNTVDNVCKKPRTEENERRDQIMDSNESNEQLLKDSEGKDQKMVNTACKEFIEEYKYKDKMMDDNLLKGKESEDQKTVENVCKEPMTKNSASSDQMMDTNRCDEQFLKDKESEDQKTVDNVFKEPITEDSGYRDQVMEVNNKDYKDQDPVDNVYNKLYNEDEDQKTVDNVCKEPMSEESGCIDRMVDDKCSEQLLEDGEDKDQKTVDDICKEPVVEDYECKDQVMDDNQYNVPIMEDKGCTDIVEEKYSDQLVKDIECEEPTVEYNVCKESVTETNEYRGDMSRVENSLTKESVIQEKVSIIANEEDFTKIEELKQKQDPTVIKDITDNVQVTDIYKDDVMVEEKPIAIVTIAETNIATEEVILDNIMMEEKSIAIVTIPEINTAAAEVITDISLIENASEIKEDLRSEPVTAEFKENDIAIRPQSENNDNLNEDEIETRDESFIVDPLTLQIQQLKDVPTENSFTTEFINNEVEILTQNAGAQIMQLKNFGLVYDTNETKESKHVKTDAFPAVAAADQTTELNSNWQRGEKASSDVLEEFLILHNRRESKELTIPEQSSSSDTHNSNTISSNATNITPASTQNTNKDSLSTTHDEVGLDYEIRFDYDFVFGLDFDSITPAAPTPAFTSTSKEVNNTTNFTQDHPSSYLSVCDKERKRIGAKAGKTSTAAVAERKSSHEFRAVHDANLNGVHNIDNAELALEFDYGQLLAIYDDLLPSSDFTPETELMSKLVMIPTANTKPQDTVEEDEDENPYKLNDPSLDTDSEVIDPADLLKEIIAYPTLDTELVKQNSEGDQPDALTSPDLKDGNSTAANTTELEKASSETDTVKADASFLSSVNNIHYEDFGEEEYALSRRLLMGNIMSLSSLTDQQLFGDDEGPAKKRRKTSEQKDEVESFSKEASNEGEKESTEKIVDKKVNEPMVPLNCTNKINDVVGATCSNVGDKGRTLLLLPKTVPRDAEIAAEGTKTEYVDTTNHVDNVNSSLTKTNAAISNKSTDNTLVPSSGFSTVQSLQQSTVAQPKPILLPTNSSPPQYKQVQVVAPQIKELSPKSVDIAPQNSIPESYPAEPMISIANLENVNLANHLQRYLDTLVTTIHLTNTIETALAVTRLFREFPEHAMTSKLIASSDKLLATAIEKANTASDEDKLVLKIYPDESISMLVDNNNDSEWIKLPTATAEVLTKAAKSLECWESNYKKKKKKQQEEQLLQQDGNSRVNGFVSDSSQLGTTEKPSTDSSTKTSCKISNHNNLLTLITHDFKSKASKLPKKDKILIELQQTEDRLKKMLQYNKHPRMFNKGMGLNGIISFKNIQTAAVAPLGQQQHVFTVTTPATSSKHKFSDHHIAKVIPKEQTATSTQESIDDYLATISSNISSALATDNARQSNKTTATNGEANYLATYNNNNVGENDNDGSVDVDMFNDLRHQQNSAFNRCDDSSNSISNISYELYNQQQVAGHQTFTPSGNFLQQQKRFIEMVSPVPTEPVDDYDYHNFYTSNTREIQQLHSRPQQDVQQKQNDTTDFIELSPHDFNIELLDNINDINEQQQQFVQQQQVYETKKKAELDWRQRNPQGYQKQLLDFVEKRQQEQAANKLKTSASVKPISTKTSTITVAANDFEEFTSGLDMLANVSQQVAATSALHCTAVDDAIPIGATQHVADTHNVADYNIQNVDTINVTEANTAVESKSVADTKAVKQKPKRKPGRPPKRKRTRKTANVDPIETFEQENFQSSKTAIKNTESIISYNPYVPTPARNLIPSKILPRILPDSAPTPRKRIRIECATPPLI